MGEQALRQAFVAALPDRIVGLEMAYENWRLAQQDEPQVLEEFYRLSHNLAGAAALYGFEQVSAPCRVLECYLLEMMRSADDPHTDVCSSDCLGHLVAAIRCVARQLNGYGKGGESGSGPSGDVGVKGGGLFSSPQN